MKTKPTYPHILWYRQFFFFVILSLCLTFFFTGCGKDDKDPVPEEVPVPIILGRDTSLTVNSASGPLSAISQNEEIATVQLNGNIILISTHKLGSTNIRVMDNAGTDKVIIKVDVQRGYGVHRITSYMTSVQASDPLIKKRIEDELNAISPLPVNAAYGFNLTGEQSPLYVFPDGLDGQMLEGVISFNSQTRTCLLKYSGQIFEYAVMPTQGFKTATTSESPMIEYGFVADFTQQYQSLYPEANIIRACRIQVLSNK
ncbi:hypothetical protein [Arcticibacter tournemirensis]